MVTIEEEDEIGKIVDSTGDSMKTKSGRIIKGRGRFRFRTPSRSRSRSVTPPHWRKEENRVVKLSELAERKTKERTPKRDVDKHMDANHSSRPNRIRNTYTPEKKIERAVDYNALDYEDQSSDEHDTAKKQVASLVQYPLNQERNNVESEKNNKENEEEEDKIINERSQFLAEALGVQIKTGQEPAKQETKQASFVGQKNKPIVLHANISGPNDFGRARQRYVSENGNQEEKGGRNKFETEKPAGNQIMARNYRSNGRQDFDNRRPVNRQGREMDRRRPNKPFQARDRQPPRIKDSRDRRRNRSSDRSREKRRSRSRSRRRSDSRRASAERKRDKDKRSSRDRRGRSAEKRKSSPKKQRSKDREHTPEQKAPVVETPAEKPDLKKILKAVEPLKPTDSTEEKYRKLLLIRQKVELLEKKRKEDEQKRLEEKQRKVKEEAEMLERAKRAKKEALEKEKLLKTYQVLQELDKRVGSNSKQKKRDSSSSSSSSSNRSRRRSRRSSSRSRQRRRRPRRRSRSSSRSSSSRRSPPKRRR
ncbi:hypothetical protein HHI36_017781 [Cryptolaemus montrouzieri]|uniref:Uncharacterized protein n=1 Tax=Cryptolaemus montrouzieri TaxID=559131 RepID=A0ABD2NNL4_9CUCU